MSVLIVAPECLEYIHAGLFRAAFNSVCDIYHSGSIHQHFKCRDVERESERLIESWCELNRLTHWTGYDDKPESLFPFIKFRTTHAFNIYQLLKYVTCLQYNIEIETIESKETYKQVKVLEVPDLNARQKEDYKLLRKWREDIRTAIIDNIMDYELALWSDIPGTKREIRGYEQKLIEENKTIVVKQLTTPLQ